MRTNLAPLSAGFVTVLVGFTSSAAILFQAGAAAGASPEEISSWMWAFGLAMGVTCIGLSRRFGIELALRVAEDGRVEVAKALRARLQFCGVIEPVVID